MRLRVWELPSSKHEEKSGLEARRIVREVLKKIGERSLLPSAAIYHRLQAKIALQRGESIYDGRADERYGEYKTGRRILLVPEITVLKDGKEMSLDEAKQKGIL